MFFPSLNKSFDFKKRWQWMLVYLSHRTGKIIINGRRHKLVIQGLMALILVNGQI